MKNKTTRMQYDFTRMQKCIDNIKYGQYILSGWKTDSYTYMLDLLNNIGNNLPFQMIYFTSEIHNSSKTVFHGSIELHVLYDCFKKNADFNLYYDLRTYNFIYTDTPETHQIQCWKLLDGKEFYHFSKNAEAIDIEAYSDISLRLQNYDIPTVTLYNYTAEVLKTIVSNI
jgi:hypothetical protein